LIHQIDSRPEKKKAEVSKSGKRADEKRPKVVDESDVDDDVADDAASDDRLHKAGHDLNDDEVGEEVRIRVSILRSRVTTPRVAYCVRKSKYFLIT
jgi:hypothetical protein